MFNSKMIASSIVLALAVVIGQVEATEVTFLGTGLGRKVDIHHDTWDKHVTAAELLIEFNDVEYTAYCVDLDHYMKSQWEADIVSVETINGGLAAAYLYDSFASSVTTNEEAAGLQVAIWEVVDDFGGALDLYDGVFQLYGPSSVADIADVFLDALPADLSGYNTSSFVLASGPCPRSQHVIVPEPASLVLLASAFPILVLGRRR